VTAFAFFAVAFLLGAFVIAGFVAVAVLAASRFAAAAAYVADWGLAVEEVRVPTKWLRGAQDTPVPPSHDAMVARCLLWLISTSTRDQSASTRNTVRIPSPARWSFSAEGPKPCRNARLMPRDHGPSASASTVGRLIANPSGVTCGERVACQGWS